MRILYDNGWFGCELCRIPEGEPAIIPCTVADQVFQKRLDGLKTVSRNGKDGYDLPDLILIADRAEERDDAVILYETLDDQTQEWMDFYMRQMALAGNVCSHPERYDINIVKQLCDLQAAMFVLNQWRYFGPPRIPDPALRPMAEQMRQVREYAESLPCTPGESWDIWEGKPLPSVRDMAEADWRYSFDTQDYRPFLIPYLVDQKKAKGNIIVVSGGGYDWRSNRWEGYETIPVLNALGWNCFLLQRRVTPYDPLDGAMDLQRSVRCIRAHAGKFHIAGVDKIAVCGFSGGGMCILDMLSEWYAGRTPADRCPGYEPDSVDLEDARVGAALIIYGSRIGSEEAEKLQANPDLPACFIIVGQKDPLGMPDGSLRLYEAVSGLVPTELHIFQNAYHGFGVGTCMNTGGPGQPYIETTMNVQVWPELADTFLDIRFGSREQFIPGE